MFKGNREQGSTTFAVLASTVALTLAGFYIQDSYKRVSQTIKSAKVSAENEAVRINDISGLSLMRGLMNPARLKSTLYEPAVYPTNYFDDTWNMRVNELRPISDVSITGKTFRLKTFKNANPTIESAQAVFGNATRSLTQELNTPNQLTILKLNYHPVHKFYVNSVDVEAKTGLTNATEKKFSTVGRIPLLPPEPGPARLEIAQAGTNNWTTNFGTQASPLPAALYKLRIIASGVVLYGEITGTKGGTLTLGMNENGITHKANNIHAVDAVLGETTDLQLGEDRTETKTEVVSENQGELSGHTTQDSKCWFHITPVGSPSSGSAGVGTTTTSSSVASTENKITVKIYRVDGEESKHGLEQTIYVQSKVTTITKTVADGTSTGGDRNGGDRCRNRCPRDRETIFGEYMEFLEMSYFGSADKTKVDVLRRIESDHLQGQGGAICGNLELVAQDLVKDMGGVLPTQINQKPNAQRNWDVVKTHVETGGSSMPLERIFAYIAPACGRELVGFRTGCGCFAEDTRIRMADGSDIRISDIREGDRVYNPKTGRSQRVKRVIAGPEKPLLFVIKVGENVVKVTENHPFLTSDGLKPANALTLDDVILDAGKATPILAIDRENRALDEPNPEVWNFELEGSENDDDHYVLANGVMTGDLKLQMKLEQASKGLKGEMNR